jgi:alpha-galactosidase
MSMSELKITIIGAGSYVFGPSCLADLAGSGLKRATVALVDPDVAMAEAMAGVGRRMAGEAGVDFILTAHADRDEALPGSDFVTCSAAVQLQKRFDADCRIIDEHYPEHLITEFGGVAGISYSLRQIALIEQIVASIQKHCPEAWLMNTANPLPRVCQAAHEMGQRTVGFCSAGLFGWRILWGVMSGQTIEYPFAEPQERFALTVGGVNHFTWLTSLRDKQTGREMLNELLDKVRGGASGGEPRSEQLATEIGYLLMAGDRHVADFLEPTGDQPNRTMAGHGSGLTRDQRLATLQSVAAGDEPLETVTAHRSWEQPGLVIAALAGQYLGGKPLWIDALNLPNEGQLPGLPEQVYVETPATIREGAIEPERIELPDAVLPMCRKAAAVNDKVVRAARERSLDRLQEAVELDPTIDDAQRGWAALRACVAEHADLLPEYA